MIVLCRNGTASLGPSPMVKPLGSSQSPRKQQYGWMYLLNCLMWMVMTSCERVRDGGGGIRGYKGYACVCVCVCVVNRMRVIT